MSLFKYLTLIIFFFLGCNSGQYRQLNKTGDDGQANNKERVTGNSSNSEEESDSGESSPKKSKTEKDDVSKSTGKSTNKDTPSKKDDNESENSENNDDDENKEDTNSQVKFIESSTAYECGDEDGRGMITVKVPSSAEKGDLLGLFLHRTDAPLYANQDAIGRGGLPLVDGQIDTSWKSEATCNMRNNGEPCTETWRHQDLVQTFMWKIFDEETSTTYNIEMPAHLKSNPHAGPQWATLVVLRDAHPESPIYASATRSPDDSEQSVFPKVRVIERGYLLLSQSFDDAVNANVFQAPDNTNSLAYVTGDEDTYGCDNDETGFLFGKETQTTNEGQEYTTNGRGVSTNKDIMISISVKPKN